MRNVHEILNQNKFFVPVVDASDVLKIKPSFLNTFSTWKLVWKIKRLLPGNFILDDDGKKLSQVSLLNTLKNFIRDCTQNKILLQYLQIIYAGLTDNLLYEDKPVKLSHDDKFSICAKLVEGLFNCNNGYFERVQSLINGLTRSESMPYMLAYYRANLLDQARNTALVNTRFSSYQVHDYEYFGHIANSVLHYAVTVGKVQIGSHHVPQDRARATLETIFKREYTPIKIVQEIFKSTFAGFKYRGHNITGYEAEVYEKIEKFLAVCLELKRRGIIRSHEDYLVTNDFGLVVDINWLQIQSDTINYFFSEGYFNANQFKPAKITLPEDEYHADGFAYQLSIQCAKTDLNSSLVTITKYCLPPEDPNPKSYYCWLGGIHFEALGLTPEIFNQLLQRCLKNDLLLKTEGEQWVIDWEAMCLPDNVANVVHQIYTLDDLKKISQLLPQASFLTVCEAMRDRWNSIITHHSLLAVAINTFGPTINVIIYKHVNMRALFKSDHQFFRVLDDIPMMEQRFLLCMALKDHLNSIVFDAIGRLLYRIAREHRGDILNCFSDDSLIRLISNYQSLKMIAELLPSAQFKDFYQKKKGLVGAYIQNGHQLGEIMLALHNAAERIAFLETIQEEIPAIIKNRADFNTILLNHYHFGEIHKVIIPMLSRRLSDFIECAYQFRCSFPYLSETDGEQIFEAMFPKLLNMIASAVDFADILFSLTPKQRARVFKQIHHKLSAMIFSTKDLACAIKYLALAERKLLYIDVKSKLNEFTNTVADIALLLEALNGDEESKFFEFIKPKLVKLIQCKSDFILILNALAPAQYDKYFDLMKGRIPADAHEIINALPEGGGARIQLIKLIAPKFLTTILADNFEATAKILKVLSTFEEYRLICQFMNKNVIAFFQKGRLKSLLEWLDETQMELFFRALGNELKYCVPDLLSLTEIVSKLNPINPYSFQYDWQNSSYSDEQRIIRLRLLLLTTLKNGLPPFNVTLANFKMLMGLLTQAECEIVMDWFWSELPKIITTGQQFDEIREYIHEHQSYKILSILPLDRIITNLETLCAVTLTLPSQVKLDLLDNLWKTFANDMRSSKHIQTALSYFPSDNHDFILKIMADRWQSFAKTGDQLVKFLGSSTPSQQTAILLTLSPHLGQIISNERELNSILPLISTMEQFELIFNAKSNQFQDCSPEALGNMLLKLDSANFTLMCQKLHTEWKSIIRNNERLARILMRAQIDATLSNNFCPNFQLFEAVKINVYAEIEKLSQDSYLHVVQLMRWISPLHHVELYNKIKPELLRRVVNLPTLRRVCVQMPLEQGCQADFFQSIKKKIALQLVVDEFVNHESLSFLPRDFQNECYTSVLRDFQRIYAALRDGQTSLLKNNYLCKLPEEPYYALPRIFAHARDSKNSRTAQALKLLEKYQGNINSGNTELVKEIYEYSFSHSMWGARSNLLGQSIFRSAYLKSIAASLSQQDWVEKISQRAQSGGDTRMGIILRAIR